MLILELIVEITLITASLNLFMTKLVKLATSKNLIAYLTTKIIVIFQYKFNERRGQ